MTFPGTLYGVVLNDSAERTQLEPQFGVTPYNAPPFAPVVYIKPRGSLASGPVRIAAGESVVASPTLALLFAHDASRVAPEDALASVGAVALALDVTAPQANYYRPAVGQAIRDGFIALGPWQPVAPVTEIATEIDGIPAHAWPLSRLVRDSAALIADLSAFMTLRAGDVLLIGLPGDAPVVKAGQTVTVTASGLPPLPVHFEESAS